MAENYTIILKDMPTTVRAITVKNEDDSYTIIVNSKLNYEQQHISFEHEIHHIQNCDFEKVCEINDIEYEAHK